MEKKPIRSMADLVNDEKRKHNTVKNKFSDFSIGDRVQIIVPCQDFTFFPTYDKEGLFGNGKVMKNSGKYLGITVRFDQGTTFNFEPSDLKNLEKAKLVSTCLCGHPRTPEQDATLKKDFGEFLKKESMQKQLEELMAAVLCGRFGTKNRVELIQRIQELMDMEAGPEYMSSCELTDKD